MMARQPSVPNRMLLTVSQYKRCEFLREAATGKKVARRAPKWRALQQPRKFLLLKPLDDFSHVLRSLARAHQDGVAGFHQHQTLHADGGDKFPGRPDIISAGVQRERRAGANVRAGFGRE